MEDALEHSSNPLAGLDWSPTWHKISTNIRNRPSPSSLVKLTMRRVINLPDLLEEICSILPSSLRKDMLALALELKVTNSIVPLLYTWSEPILSLKSIFPYVNHDPELVGDLHNQVEATRLGCVSVAILIQLLIKKVISILVRNSNSVKVLDLTGFPVLRVTLEELFQAKFKQREQLEIILDVWIPEHSKGDSGWIELMKGTKNFSLKIHNVHCCSLREPIRNKIIESALKTNKDMQGLKLSCLNFVDWPEVKRTLNVLNSCSSLSKLDLSRNNLFDSSPNDEAGRSWVNKTLMRLLNLSRLDLSFNLLSDRIGSVLTGLKLTYLNLTACRLTIADVQHIVRMKTLVHLDLSQNDIGDAFCYQLTKSCSLVNLEILELEDCFISSNNFPYFLSFARSCMNLKILNASYNTLEVLQIIDLIHSKFEILLVFSKFLCTCSAQYCDCYDKGKNYVMDELARFKYELKSFDKESACNAIQTQSKFIVFKGFRDGSVKMKTDLSYV